MPESPADTLRAALEQAVSDAIRDASATVPSADWVNGYAAGARSAIEACIEALEKYRGLPHV